MKHIILISCILFWLVPMGFADEPIALSQQAMESIQQQTMEMSDAGVPEAQAKKMLTLMLQNRFEKQNRIQAQKIVMNAAADGIPTEPIMSKAMEGMAKQAKEQNVIMAMENVRHRYMYAYQWARGLSSDEETVDTVAREVADGMAAGMSAEDMEKVMAQLRVQVQTRQQTMNAGENDKLAIETATTTCTMARLGVGSSETAEIVGEALQNRYTHREMEQLRHQFIKKIQNASAQQISDQYAGSINKGGKDMDSSSGSGSSSSGSGSSSSGSGSSSGGGGSSSGGGGSSSGGGRN